MKALRDRHDELFVTVTFLIQEGSLTHKEIKEFIDIMETASETLC